MSTTPPPTPQVSPSLWAGGGLKLFNQFLSDTGSAVSPSLWAGGGLKLPSGSRPGDWWARFPQPLGWGRIETGRGGGAARQGSGRFPQPLGWGRIETENPPAPSLQSPW